ncbi:hypothetical protein Hdeb2414_s0003g00109431 [Helianthus debilis subsp. tardiflorus]
MIMESIVIGRKGLLCVRAGKGSSAKGCFFPTAFTTLTFSLLTMVEDTSLATILLVLPVLPHYHPPPIWLCCKMMLFLLEHDFATRFTSSCPKSIRWGA